MNYLAHIHIAHSTGTSLLGNFLGDFVKGSDLTAYPEHLRKGIVLHRKIDSYTDNHAAVMGLKECFPQDIRRFSGLVIDVHFDHLLCQFWHKFNTPDLHLMLDKFYQELRTTEVSLDGRFNQVRQGLLQHQWLSDYQEFSSVIRACHQIEKRLSRPVAFVDKAKVHLQDNTEQFEEAFLSLYPELSRYAQGVAEQL